MRDQVGSIEVGAIEEIKNLRPELQVQPFENVRLFKYGKIPGRQARADVRVSSDVAEEAAVIRWSDKSVGIKPLTGISEDHRAGKCRIKKRPDRVTRVSVIGRVIAQLRSEWKSGLRGHNAIQRPSAKRMSESAAPGTQKFSAPPKRQFVSGRHDANVSNVVGCESPVYSRHVWVRKQGHCIRRRGCVQRVAVIH